jgi:general secretion pathway protein I
VTAVPAREPVDSVFARGFTLLEVMVAVMILGFVLVTLLGLKNRSMEDVLYAEHMTQATLLAKRVMTQTLLTKDLRTSEDEGEFEDDAFKMFSWRKVVASTPLPGVLEVRVAVLWKEGTRQEQVELVGYE